MRRESAAAAALASQLLAEASAAADAVVLDNLAWVLSGPESTGAADLDLALQAATRAVELTHGRGWEPLQTLARVWERRGDFEKAVAAQEQAVRVLDCAPLRAQLDQCRRRWRL